MADFPARSVHRIDCHGELFEGNNQFRCTSTQDPDYKCSWTLSIPFTQEQTLWWAIIRNTEKTPPQTTRLAISWLETIEFEHILQQTLIISKNRYTYVHLYKIYVCIICILMHLGDGESPCNDQVLQCLRCYATRESPAAGRGRQRCHPCSCQHLRSSASAAPWGREVG